jgi:hypothetical protein
MKRTVKVWVAAVMSGVLLAGGAAMTGQAPWGMEAQAHSGRTDGITRMPAGWEAITTTAEVIRHTCIPMECVPMQEAGKVPRPRPGPRQKPRHKPRPRLKHRPRPRPRHRPRRRLSHRNRQWSGQLPGQEKLQVLRAGIRMGHTGTISARTEPV